MCVIAPLQNKSTSTVQVRTLSGCVFDTFLLCPKYSTGFWNVSIVHLCDLHGKHDVSREIEKLYTPEFKLHDYAEKHNKAIKIL